MRRLVRVVVLTVTLSALSLPAIGHTNYGHSHTCNSSHGYVLDSSTTRHSIGPGVHPNSAFLIGQHRFWIAQGGGSWSAWKTAHTNYVYC